MSKSATDERKWGFKGKQTPAAPPSRAWIELQIVPGCECYACRENRKHLKRLEKANDK